MLDWGRKRSVWFPGPDFLVWALFFGVVLGPSLDVIGLGFGFFVVASVDGRAKVLAFFLIS